MARPWNHYEAAFEAFLRSIRIPYVSVDERRRALLGDQSLKNLDFIVSPPDQISWLIDVKGRKFPGGEEGRHYWKNWIQHEDLFSLERWEQLFGGGFRGLLVFAYLLVRDRAPVPPSEIFDFRGQAYAFVGIELDVYRRYARPISDRWDTVAMPAPRFREHAQRAHALFEVEVSSLSAD
ncbi:MAG: HYExAFE family protein [Planctomycetales bacterium]|nr:HYExAFE family protein [Planctomycetales bacterium]